MLVLACGSDGTPFVPTVEVVAGSYVAARFETVQNGVTVNQLARGSSLQLTLAEDGTTTGRLFVPGGDDDGSDLDRDLTGTWTLAGSIVTLVQEADTFLRDMPLTASAGRLTGEQTFASGTVRLRLDKQ